MEDEKILQFETTKPEEVLIEENYVYRFEEMTQSMEASIKNIDKVSNEQEKLIEVIENSEEKDFFEEFLNESKEQLQNLKVQKETISNRLVYINEFIDLCRNNEDANKALTLLVKGLNLFE